MAEKLTKRQKFKRFLKKNMTVTWAKHFAYQVFAFIVSVVMVIGVARYAFYKSYDDRTLSFVDDFTVTAHTGAYDTASDSMEFIDASVEHNADCVQIDVRVRPDDTVVMSDAIITTNNDGVEITSVFKKLKDSNIMLNLNIKDTKALKLLYDLIVQYGLCDRVFITGIDIFQADKVTQNCPDIEFYINYQPSRIKIFSDDYQQKIIEILEKTGAIGINCPNDNASRTLSDFLHKNGYKLSIWTADTNYQMKRALINKPDNILTNYPDDIEKTIENWSTE